MGLAVSLVGVAVCAQSAGHRVSGNQVVINGRNHWQNWEFAPGTLTISPDGAVRSRRIQKNTNAVFDIVDYLRFNPPASLGDKEPAEIVLSDAVKGGSNVADVVNLLDGDLSTYWQPDTPAGDRDLASQWWFVIDLGRVVFAKELVVRFVEEGMGDPFLLFEVLISDGLKPARLQNSENPAFKTVLRTLSENKSQRVFTVDLTNEQPNVEAAAVRFVQILVTDTDGMLGTEVSAAEYDALSEETRGAIQYFKRQPDGREVPVDPDLYDILDADRRGSVRYFRRELPRLAELEVWNRRGRANRRHPRARRRHLDQCEAAAGPDQVRRWRLGNLQPHLLRSLLGGGRSRAGAGLRLGFVLLGRYLPLGLQRRFVPQLPNGFFRPQPRARRQPPVDHQGVAGVAPHLAV